MHTNLYTLPHTGLQVPYLGLSIDAYAEAPTSDGVAFTAALLLHGRMVGLVENIGHGGPTTFTPNGNGFPRREFEAFVAQCRTAAGNPATEEHVLDDLVTEHTTAQHIADCQRFKLTPLRMMALIAGEPYMVAQRECGKLIDPVRAWLEQRLADRHPADPPAWWQAWDGKQWVDVTARPAS